MTSTPKQQILTHYTISLEICSKSADIKKKIPKINLENCVSRVKNYQSQTSVILLQIHNKWEAFTYKHLTEMEIFN